MSRHHETNPHFLPRQQDPTIEFPSQTPPPRSRHQPRRHGRTPPAEPPPYGSTPPHGPPPRRHGRTPPAEPSPYESAPPHGPPPHRHGRTPPAEPPPYGSRYSPPHGPLPPAHHPSPHIKPVPPPHVSTPPQDPHPPTHHPPARVKPVPPPFHVESAQHNHESRPHSTSDPDTGRRHSGGRHGPAFIHPATSQRTKPVAWLLAAFCALFWILVIVGGVIILIVYLVFRPRSPRFDISSTTFNAAYLDMGYLLNADVTVLANFTNPNTKVKVEFSYVILDLYYNNHFLTTRYIDPFSVMKGESRFADVHMVASQVRLSTAQSVQLQKQIEEGRVPLEIKGLFRARSKLGGIFHYSYWLYAHCQLVVTGPPTGVLIGKKCLTKRNI